ncbi:MAG: CheA signal transduction histidine kinase [Promethearchaeota archaeon CR_4]|nr:MAG: CheA signal transduction histidine kinase [Candidatus Lokiarchaeota archaeon CR_4]
MPAAPKTQKKPFISVSIEKQAFLEEARQLIYQLGEKLVTLTVDSLKDEVEDYYLIFHTLKGNSRMMNQKEMQELFHALGILLLDVKDFDLQPNEEVISILKESLKVTSNALKMFAVGRVPRVKMNTFRERVIAASIPPEKKDISQQLERQAQYFQDLGINNTPGRTIDFQDGSTQFFEVRIVLDETVFLKKTRVYTIIRNLTQLDESVRFGKVTPSIDELLAGRFGLEFALILQSTKTSDQLKKIVKYSGEIANVTIRMVSTKEAISLLK